MFKKNAKWNIKDFFHAITLMCNSNSYLESAMNELAVRSYFSNPSGKWIRNCIQSMPEQSMIRGLSNGIDCTIFHLKKLGMFKKPVTVTIDKHFICRYDKTDSSSFPYLVKSRPKNDSTVLFEGYGSIQCIEKSCRTQIGAVPIKKRQTKADIVRNLISDCIRNAIKIRYILLDREFFSTATINELKKDAWNQKGNHTTCKRKQRINLRIYNS